MLLLHSRSKKSRAWLWKKKEFVFKSKNLKMLARILSPFYTFLIPINKICFNELPLEIISIENSHLSVFRPIKAILWRPQRFAYEQQETSNFMKTKENPTYIRNMVVKKWIRIYIQSFECLTHLFNPSSDDNREPTTECLFHLNWLTGKCEE